MMQDEREQLLQLIRSPWWRIVEQIANEHITRIRSEPTTKETEWETLKEAIAKDERVAGIQLLITSVKNEANHEV